MNGRLRAHEPYPDHPSELKANGHKPARAKPSKVGSNRWSEFNTFVDSTLRQLTRRDIVVWMILFRDTKDGVARTGVADIARRGGLSARSVITAIQKLESVKLLKVVNRGGLNKGASTYQVRPINEGVTYEA